jgi:CRISPR-associated protein Csb1
MNETQGVSMYDDWLKEDSDAAALVMHTRLVPVEGRTAVVFPPTYNLEQTEGARRFNAGEQLPGWYENSKGQAYGYNIDLLKDGTTVCQIDSVGSQANRMEPIFLRSGYQGLVPSVVVRANVNGQQRRVNLLDAGHRAADAVVRFSSLWPELESAFNAIREDGNAGPLAKIAPTSIVFGVWDSRGTQVKLPRILRSVIRAYDVQPLHRSAQYIPAVDYVEGGLLDPPAGKTEEASMSQLGLRHAPAPWTHGGILVRREIRREAALNLAALHGLGSEPGNDALPLRRYIFGLALVALTAPQETLLREGCQLVPDAEQPAEWSIVRHDGKNQSWKVDHKEAKRYADQAAELFGVGSPREGTFDTQAARQAVGQTKEERKKSRRAAETADQGAKS